MTDILRYLAEEIALDYKDGFFPRREALRRLALLGVGAATASSLLACSSNPEPTEQPTSTTDAAPPGSSGPSASASAPASASASAPEPPPVWKSSKLAEPMTFAGPEGKTLMGAFAPAKAPKGGVLVIHENKGMMDHFRDVAGRFADAGYSALAIDLLSEEGGTASLGDPANATAALGKAPPERFVADMKAGLTELSKRAPNLKLGMIGFCFGGGMTWRMIGSKDARLAAAAPFYGQVPDDADFTGSKAAVLAVYAAKDERVNASRDKAKALLEKAKLKHEIVTFEGADHAFFNDTGKRYEPTSAAKAWDKVMEWFGVHLAKK